MTREELHDQVDAEFAPLVQACLNENHFFGMAAWIDAWRQEKEYIERYGQRVPKLRITRKVQP